MKRMKGMAGRGSKTDKAKAPRERSREVEFDDDESAFDNPLVGKTLQMQARTSMGGQAPKPEQGGGVDGGVEEAAAGAASEPEAGGDDSLGNEAFSLAEPTPSTMAKPGTMAKGSAAGAASNRPGRRERARPQPVKRERRYSQAVQAKVNNSKWAPTGQAANAEAAAQAAIEEADREMGVGRNTDGSAPDGFFKLSKSGAAESPADLESGAQKKPLKLFGFKFAEDGLSPSEREANGEKPLGRPRGTAATSSSEQNQYEMSTYEKFMSNTVVLWWLTLLVGFLLGLMTGLLF
jgi:hypothetical protein